MIIGDADCISNGEITESRSQTNFVMDLGTYHWLSNNDTRGYKESATNG